MIKEKPELKTPSWPVWLSPAERRGLLQLEEQVLRACHPDNTNRLRDAGHAAQRGLEGLKKASVGLPPSYLPIFPMHPERWPSVISDDAVLALERIELAADANEAWLTRLGMIRRISQVLYELVEASEEAVRGLL